MAYGIKLRISGDFALPRPEIKAERFSYDVPTPSAARGILEANSLEAGDCLGDYPHSRAEADPVHDQPRQSAPGRGHFAIGRHSAVNRTARSLLTAALAVATCIAATAPAVAGPRGNQLNLSTNMRQGSIVVSSNYLRALSGDLRTDGMQIRLETGFGNYSTASGPDRQRYLTGLLVGYQFVGGRWRSRAFAGPTYAERSRASAAEEDRFGVKFLVTTQTDRSGDHAVSASASYSTLENAYRLSLQTGLRFNDIFVGPEFAVLGSDRFRSQRVGLSASGIRINRLSLTLRAGYAFGGEEGGDDRNSSYAGISMTMQF